MPAVRVNHQSSQALTPTVPLTAPRQSSPLHTTDTFERALPGPVTGPAPLALPAPVSLTASPKETLAPITTPGESTPLISVVSEAKAQQLFAGLLARTDIPFLYHEEGCFARAHQMARVLEEQGFSPAKAFVHGNLRVRSPYSGQRNPYTGKIDDPGYIFWRYHVAVALWVETDAGRELRVIDPSICDGPVPVKEWTDRQTEVPGSTASAPYFTSRYVYKFHDRSKPLSAWQEADLKDMDYTTSRYLTDHENRTRVRAYGVSDVQKKSNDTLYAAVTANDLKQVRKAIEGGADLKGVYGEGREDHLLNTAIRTASINVVAALLDAGATHRSSLLIATEANKIDVIKELLARSSEDFGYTHHWDHKTALKHAVYYRQFDIIPLLLGACGPEEVNSSGPDGKTALFFAVNPGSNSSVPKEDSLKLTRMLIAAGAEVDVVSKRGETPLGIIEKYIAAKKGSLYPSQIKFLMTLREIKKALLQATPVLREAA